MTTDIRNVIVTPGKVAFLTPAAKERFTDKPRPVIWNGYLEELLTEHHDISVVGEVAAYKHVAEKPAVEKPAVEKPVVEKPAAEKPAPVLTRQT